MCGDGKKYEIVTRQRPVSNSGGKISMRELQGTRGVSVGVRGGDGIGGQGRGLGGLYAGGENFLLKNTN